MTAADHASARERYLRPIKLGIALSVLGESVIFVVWGLVLYPEGSVVNKLLWTVLFCGVGMGSAVGATVSLLVVDRLEGWKAVAATTAASVLMLGVACDLLCLQLDRHFLYFGGTEDMGLFLGGGLAMSTVGGVIVGWACFLPSGRAAYARLAGPLGPRLESIARGLVVALLLGAIVLLPLRCGHATAAASTGVDALPAGAVISSVPS